MQHPIFYALTRAATRREMRQRGYPLGQIREALEACADELIDAAAVRSGGVGAIGDGKIVEAVIEFLKSPQGQALIDVLIKILTAVLDIIL